MDNFENFTDVESQYQKTVKLFKTSLILCQKYRLPVCKSDFAQYFICLT